MKDYSITVPAGDARTLYAVGTFIRIKDANGPLHIQTNRGDMAATLSAGQRVSEIQQFDSLEIRNDGAASVTATIVIGFGNYEDNQVVGKVDTSVSTRVNALADITIDGGNTAVIANNSARRELHIHNNAAEPVRWGGTEQPPGYSSGCVIPPGMIAVIPTAGEVRLFNPGVQQVMLNVSEVLN